MFGRGFFASILYFTRGIYRRERGTDSTTPERFYGHNNLGQSMSRTFIYRAGWLKRATKSVRVCAVASARLRRFVCALAAHVACATRRRRPRSSHRDAHRVYATSHTIGQEHRACARVSLMGAERLHEDDRTTKKKRCNSGKRETSLIKLQKVLVVCSNIHFKEITEIIAHLI